LCADALRSILRSVLRRFVALIWLVAITLTLACVIAACKRSGETAAEPAPPPPVVTDASGDLLFTWVDEKGEFHVEQRAADVPVTARDVVRVVDPSRDGPPGGDVWIADLRNLGPQGSYPVRAMKRSELDAIAGARREKSGGVLAAKPPSSAPEVTQPAVIIYGASWCGPCHQAASYLKQRNVAFVEKDIEQDSGAAREMQAKLAKANRRGGSIPVLDVRGQILIGFDPRAVDQALGQPL
jgi:glutaredoxin